MFFEAVCMTWYCNDTVWPLCPIDFKVQPLFLGACLGMSLPSTEPRCRHTETRLYKRKQENRELQPRSRMPAHTSCCCSAMTDLFISHYTWNCYTLIADLFHLSFRFLWWFCSPVHEQLTYLDCVHETSCNIKRTSRDFLLVSDFMSTRTRTIFFPPRLPRHRFRNIYVQTDPSTQHAVVHIPGL